MLGPKLVKKRKQNTKQTEPKPGPKPGEVSGRLAFVHVQSHGRMRRARGRGRGRQWWWWIFVTVVTAEVLFPKSVSKSTKTAISALKHNLRRSILPRPLYFGRLESDLLYVFKDNTKLRLTVRRRRRGRRRGQRGKAGRQVSKQVSLCTYARKKCCCGKRLHLREREHWHQKHQQEEAAAAKALKRAQRLLASPNTSMVVVQAGSRLLGIKSLCPVRLRKEKCFAALRATVPAAPSWQAILNPRLYPQTASAARCRYTEH
jgi:hypothetical protein